MCAVSTIGSVWNLTLWNKNKELFEQFIFSSTLVKVMTKGQRKFLNLNSDYFQYQSFLNQSADGSLSLATWITFQQPNCRKWKLIEINRFSNRLRKWTTPEYFVEKFDNFNGCELSVRAPYPQTNVLQIEFNNQGNLTNIRGYGPVFNHEISKSLNYSYVYKPFDLKRKENITKCDFEIKAESFRRINLRTPLDTFIEKFVHPFVTDRFTTIDEIIIISRFETFSQFEKIFLPFEIEIWHWLIAVMSIASFVICILKTFASEKVKKFVFGTVVQSPMLNLMWDKFDFDRSSFEIRLSTLFPVTSCLTEDWLSYLVAISRASSSCCTLFSVLLSETLISDNNTFLCSRSLKLQDSLVVNLMLIFSSKGRATEKYWNNKRNDGQ